MAYEITLNTIKIDAFRIEKEASPYLINGVPHKDLTRLHACSPELNINTNLPFKSAIYFISCDFRGRRSDEYSVHKLKAVKAYFETLERTFNLTYRVVVCDVLPRHNWLWLMRNKKVFKTEIEKILDGNKNNGQHAAQTVYELLNTAELCEDNLGMSENDCVEMARIITESANKDFLQECQKLFSDEKTMAWSNFLPSLSADFSKRQEILKECDSAIRDGAAKREGCLEDNIYYKQEELVVGLHISETMRALHGTTIGFYNRYSSQKAETGHMDACMAYGYLDVLDIRFCEENIIHETLLRLNLIARKVMKPNDAEKQLSFSLSRYVKLEPSLQLNFVLELLKEARDTIPAQYKFLDSCLKLYNTLSPERQLQFITALLEHPKKVIAAYHDYLANFDRYYANRYGVQTLTQDIIEETEVTQSSWDPRKLFAFQEKIKQDLLETTKLSDEEGKRPLHYMAITENPMYGTLYGGADVISSMAYTAVLAGADINVIDKQFRTPAHWAMQYGSHKTAKVLFEAGARGDIRDLGGSTPLYYAKHNRSKKNRSRVEDFIGLFDETEALLNRLYDCKEVSIYFKFLRKFDKEYTICFHIFNKTHHYARTLEKAIKESNSQLMDAINQNMKNDVHHISTLFVGQNEFSTTLLHLIILKFSPPRDRQDFKNDEVKMMINALILSGADLNMCDGRGHTPLSLSIILNNIEISEMLIDAGARTDIVDFDGFTQLELAIYKKNVDHVSLIQGATSRALKQSLKS